VEKEKSSIKETFELALQNHQKNNIDKAEILYKQILKIKPNHAQTNFLLGTLFAQKRKFDLAMQLLKKAIQIQPNFTEAYNNLGNVQKELGQNQEATVSFEKAIQINPNYSDAYNGLGNIKRELGDIQKAMACFEKTIQINPRYLHGHNNLGMIFKESGESQKSINCFKKTIEIQPNYIQGYNNLGIVFLELERFDEAMNCFQKAIHIDPNYAKAHYNLGLVNVGLKNREQAISYFQRAIQIIPDYVQAYYSIMDILEKTHNLQQLYETIEKAEASLGNNPIIYIFKALILIKENKYTEAKTLLESRDIEKYQSISPENKIKYYELLSKVYDYLNETEKSYKYFVKINQHDSKKIVNRGYNKEYFFKEIEINKTYFTSKNILKWNKINKTSEKTSPTFLVGFPRSGTTLLDTILRSHPSIEVIEEEFMVEKMKSFFNNFSQKNINSLDNINEDFIKKAHNIYFDKLNAVLDASKQKNKVIIDKMPLNIMEVGFIHRVFPQSKFIFSLRHPCDCVLSCFMSRFKMNNAMVNFNDMLDAISFYNQIMSLWKQYTVELPIQFKTIKYENVVKDLKNNITTILNFLNLEWDDVMLSFNKTALNRTIINTPSYNQVIKPLYNHAIGRWERYEDIVKIYPKLEKWVKEFDY